MGMERSAGARGRKHRANSRNGRATVWGGPVEVRDQAGNVLRVEKPRNVTSGRLAPVDKPGGAQRTRQV